MVGPFLLLAASLAPAVSAVPAQDPGVSGSRPAMSATAHATVRIRIISGVRFGQDSDMGGETASRRSALIRQPDGSLSPANLLEFQ